MTVEARSGSSAAAERSYDVLVVGAGFAGLRALHEIRKLGMSAHIVDAAPEIGGTWYWNRFPGARTDSESWVYAYAFPEIQNEWRWHEKYPSQDQALAYLNFVADRLDMHPDITLGVRIAATRYDEDAHRWTATTDSGQTWQARVVILATGILSVPYVPEIPGVESFGGQLLTPARWPQEDVDFDGKRVAVIGTGASGVQIIPAIAPLCSKVQVFQRSPAYVIPARNYPILEWQRTAILRDYEKLWQESRDHPLGNAVGLSPHSAADVTPEERQRILENGWEVGGLRFYFDTFYDILTNQFTNDVVADFVRSKIRAIVRDPKTAELLCPDYPVFGKRPPLGHHYYEAFNRDNVELVDISEEPIGSFSPTGITVGDQHHEVDIVIWATGYDAMTGSILNIDIRGRDGTPLQERWAGGAQALLGAAVDGFPNLFLAYGPQSPLGNAPVAQEASCHLIVEALRAMQEQGMTEIEAEAAAIDDWQRTVDDAVAATILSHGTKSWLFGDNIPGKPRTPQLFFGGVSTYRDKCQGVVDGDFKEFTFRP